MTAREEFVVALSRFERAACNNYTAELHQRRMSREELEEAHAEVLRLFDVASQPVAGVEAQPGPERFEIDLRDYFFVEAKEVGGRLVIDLQRKTEPAPAKAEAGWVMVPRRDYFGDNDPDRYFADGWNACRASMLQAAPHASGAGKDAASPTQPELQPIAPRVRRGTDASS